MDKQLRKRIYMFYFAGVFNLVLGIWVVMAGGELEPATRKTMMLFFFGFAMVDFWFPKHLKKKYEEQQALLAQASPVQPVPQSASQCVSQPASQSLPQSVIQPAADDSKPVA